MTGCRFLPDGQRGFTLIEVLVAVAVLAIALTSVYRLHRQTITMSAMMQFDTLAPMLAQSRLAGLKADENGRWDTGSQPAGEDYPGYTISVETETMPADMFKDQRYHMARIDITVTDQDENAYQLRTYRLYTTR